jgi:nucleoid-associated protein YgaU
MRPRQGRTAVAVLAVAAFAAIIVWFGILQAPRPTAPRAPEASAGGGAPSSPTPQPSDAARAPSPPASSDPKRPESAAAARQDRPRDQPAAASEPAGQAAPAAPPPSAGTVVPSFDVVRVEPSGESVIAGRAAPGATIDLLRDGTSHARAAADSSGLFAFVPPPLPPGSHEIVLQSIAPDGTRTRSRDSITVVIADDKATKPLVALASPDRPTVLLSNPDRPSPAAGESTTQAPPRASDVAAAPPPAAPAEPGPRRPDAPAPAAAQRPSVRIAAIDAEDGGRLFVSGQAAPGATVRLYLNDTLIAPGGAGADGKVAFAIGRGVRPGDYRVRLDDVDPVSGDVKSRAEVQFSMPVQVAVPLPPQTDPLVTGPQELAALPPAAGGPATSPTRQPRAERRPEAAGTRAAAPPNATEQRATEHAIDAGMIRIPEINTAIVARGDNLWNISRRIYGHGLRYTVIYGANQPQIRNPDLIYPGQVFVLPLDQVQPPRL